MQTPVPLSYARHTSRFLTLWLWTVRLPSHLTSSPPFLTHYVAPSHPPLRPHPVDRREDHKRGRSASWSALHNTTPIPPLGPDWRPISRFSWQLPMVLVAELGWGLVLVSGFMTWALFGIQEIGLQIEVRE